MADNQTPRGAILQRDKQTYAIVPRTPLGILTPDIIEALAGVVKKFQIPIVKITSGQRLALVGMPAEQVEPIWQELGAQIGQATELCVHFVQACPGTSVCQFGVQDSLALGGKLEKMFVGMELPAKFKIGVSGCPLCCAEGFVRDMGLIGKKTGWTLIFGGHPGAKPRIGDVVAEDLTKEQVIDLTEKILTYYAANAKKRERAARFVERVGIEAIRQALL